MFTCPPSMIISMASSQILCHMPRCRWTWSSGSYWHPGAATYPPAARISSCDTWSLENVLPHRQSSGCFGTTSALGRIILSATRPVLSASTWLFRNSVNDLSARSLISAICTISGLSEGLPWLHRSSSMLSDPGRFLRDRIQSLWECHKARRFSDLATSGNCLSVYILRCHNCYFCFHFTLHLLSDINPALQ